MSIIFSDADDEAWCDDCDARLIERKDGSSICSNCSRVYTPDSVQKHHMELQPEKNPYSNEGPELVSITGYTEQQQKKKPSVFDKEDKFIESKKTGFKFIESEDITFS
jgi:uncharacterized Zn finger protein (UPF0148 family)